MLPSPKEQLLMNHRIAEINVANICACMPVLTPIARSARTSLTSFWNSVKSYYTRAPAGSSSPLDSDSDRHQDGNKGENRLPQVHMGTISSLRSFIGQGHGTNVENTKPKQSIGAIVTVNSVGHDYHRQLKDIRSDELEDK